MLRVRRHYNRVSAEIENPTPISLIDIQEPIVILPIDRWTRISEKGLRFAMMLSSEIRAVHVHTGEADMNKAEEEDELTPIWRQKVLAPVEAANLPAPRLVILRSPFRFIVAPLVDYILKTERENPHRQIAVMVPELVVSKWWQNALHNQRAQVLKLLLLVKGSQRVIVINVPWYLDQPAPVHTHAPMNPEVTESVVSPQGAKAD
jgi:hypothetical protein